MDKTATISLVISIAAIIGNVGGLVKEYKKTSKIIPYYIIFLSLSIIGMVLAVIAI